MAIRMLSWLMMLAILTAVQHLALAHRGTEDDVNTQNGHTSAGASSLASVEMLPQGHLHLKSSRQVGPHNHSIPISLLEASSLLEESSSEVGQTQGTSDSLTADASVPPTGPQITITLPYGSFVVPGPPPGLHIQPGETGPPPVPIIQHGLTIPHSQAGAPPASTTQHGLIIQQAPAGPPPVPTTQQGIQGPATLNDGRAGANFGHVVGTPQTSKSDEKTVAWVGQDFEGLFSKMPYTVIRIQTIVGEVDWFEPYRHPREMEFTGSGFAVDVPYKEDPIFITNAHVVRNARDVQIQLPALGQIFFEAHVPLICDEFDLAVVQLKDPAKFFDALSKVKPGAKLETLPVTPDPLILGLEVASVGFPLSSTSMKLSRGVISGTEEVGDFICYQTTAPISPGSSGGPLFALDTNRELRVVGATFASSAQRQAQNINFVVPAVAIMQVIAKHSQKRAEWMAAAAAQAEEVRRAPVPPAAAQTLSDHLESPLRHHLASPLAHHLARKRLGPPRIDHFQFNFAPIDAIGIEGNQPLYETYKCKSGVFISKILPSSVFLRAEPALEEKTFLTSVDGVPLDGLGMGRTAAFLHDPTPFESLMMMKVGPGDKVKVTTCKYGKEVEHILSMEWHESYRTKIHNIVEPYFEPDALKYEIFAGITVMDFTLNHVIRLLKAGEPPTLGRWLLPEYQDKPRLLVTHVQEGSYASRVISPGMVIDKINDKEIGCLDEYRDMSNFWPPEKSSVWTLETDRGFLFTTDFKRSLIEQIQMGKAGMTYLFCDSVVRAGERLEKEMEANQQHQAEKPQHPGSLAEKTSTFNLSSLAESTSTPNSASLQMQAPERVTRLAKIDALVASARAPDSSEDIDKDEVRRRARVAQSGFFRLPASAYVPDEHLEAELPFSRF